MLRMVNRKKPKFPERNFCEVALFLYFVAEVISLFGTHLLLFWVLQKSMFFV